MLECEPTYLAVIVNHRELHVFVKFRGQFVHPLFIYSQTRRSYPLIYAFKIGDSLYKKKSISDYSKPGHMYASIEKIECLNIKNTF